MAAYAALVSLMNTMEQIKNHPRLSTCLDENQVESLGEKLDFLLDFVERYDSCRGGKEEAEMLESQIASAAHAAEDVIESHIVDHILVGNRSAEGLEDHLVQMLAKTTERNIPLLDLQTIIFDMDSIKEKVKKVADQLLAGSNQSSSISKLDLQKLIEDNDSLEKVMEVKDEGRFKNQHQHTTAATSSRTSTTAKTSMVGFNDYLLRLKDTLTGHQSNLQVIPIVGMGGIGKTTLARNAFEDLLIVEFFYVRIWATLSENYSVREILFELLSSQVENSESLLGLDQRQLGEELYKTLWGRRYLIILDDIWSVDAWYDIKNYFPNNGNGSCIVITTRLKEVALHFGSSYLAIDFLDEDISWNLLREKTFGQEVCPTELEEAGRKIAKNCKGLPLSIVVIGGFLRKSDKSKEFWENVAKDTNSFLNSEGEEQCLDILSLSYNHLPTYLKPCFLYMGVFPEDDEIRASQLIKLWVAEGFLKPNESKSLENVAECCLKDLVDRNLVLVCKWKSNGKIQSCYIHDLVRALCLRVAEKEKFLCVMKLLDTLRGVKRECRIMIDENNVSCNSIFHALESKSLARSLICKGERRSKLGMLSVRARFLTSQGHQSLLFKLLRVLSAIDEGAADGCFVEDDFMCVNLRCLDRRFTKYMHDRRKKSEGRPSMYFPRIISRCWNLQTISFKGCNELICAPSEIWGMPQLRHLKVDMLHLPDPPPSEGADIVLENLQTLGRVWNFRVSEEVCKRIPNIKKLSISYDDWRKESEASSYYCPHNLGRFQKLESLNFYFGRKYWRDFPLNNAFPASLKKLSLQGGYYGWEDMSLIGSLPHLEALKLGAKSVFGYEWNPVVGEFRRLKFLKIHDCYLGKWNADDSHFPILEKLVLGIMTSLQEIPLGIGEIPTLSLIHLSRCSLSCAVSAMKILEERESLGAEDLQVEVEFHFLNKKALKVFKERMEEEGFKSNNLKVGTTVFFEYDDSGR